MGFLAVTMTSGEEYPSKGEELWKRFNETAKIGA